MGITKTDFMRGMQCERMLWLDRHHPEFKVIPPFVQKRLDRGNEFGDSAMGIFGEYTEVKEYYPGTKYPDKVKMAAKTRELLSEDTKVICERGSDGESDHRHRGRTGLHCRCLPKGSPRGRAGAW